MTKRLDNDQQFGGNGLMGLVEMLYSHLRPTTCQILLGNSPLVGTMPRV
jgi:hypothetical protein